MRMPFRVYVGHVVVVPILALGLVMTGSQVGAQKPPRVARVGLLLSGPQSTAAAPARKAFQEGLAQLGWIEGQNLLIESRFTAGRAESPAALAEELVRAQVQVIVASNVVAVRAAKETTATIPIVGIGTIERLVGSLARPQGNVTGLVTVPAESWGKQLELLKEAVPKISRIAYFVEGTPGSTELADRAAAIGRSLPLTVHAFGARGPDELEAAFREALERRVDGVALVETPVLLAHRARIVDFVAKHKLPAVSMFSSFPESGFLMSYGTSIPELFRRAAYYVDRLLKGARPADLPVEQPTKFELVVNLRTAKTLGLTLPPSIVVRADRLIE